MHNLWPEIVRWKCFLFFVSVPISDSSVVIQKSSVVIEIVFTAITNFQIITLFFEFILIQFIPATRFNIINEFYIKIKCDD